MCEPKTLEKVSNEMLLMEINERRRRAQKERKEFLKTHCRSMAFSRMSMAVLGVFLLLGATSPLFALKPIIGGIASLLFIALFVFVRFKEVRGSAQFKKAYPEEDKLLSDS